MGIEIIKKTPIKEDIENFNDIHFTNGIGLHKDNHGKDIDSFFSNFELSKIKDR